MDTQPAAYDINEVLDRVQNQDPTVKNVRVKFGLHGIGGYDPQIDWRVAAKCIKESRYVKYLLLSAVFELGEGVHNNDSMIQFCNWLAGNKSIERLDLRIDNLEGSVETEKLFELLGQFFANNEKLESLRIEYDGCAWISKRSIRALCSGTSVRNITIWKSNPNVERVTREEEDLVCALIEHYPLKKLSFCDHQFAGSGALVGENVSSCIKSMLEDPKCKLESLSLNNWGDCTDINLSRIASGLANNTSVKTISCTGGRPHFLLDINTENHTLEVLNLGGPLSLHRQSEDLAVALNKFRALKSLDLSGHTTTPEALIAIFKQVLMPPFRLENLILSETDGGLIDEPLCCIVGGLNDESLKALGECIAANKTLKTLDLSCQWQGNITTTGWASFFRQLRKTALLKLESIDLQNRTEQRNKLGTIISYLPQSIN
jgi:hypothetical protein